VSVANLASFYESKCSPLGPRKETGSRPGRHNNNTPIARRDDDGRRKLDARRAAMLEERQSERRREGTSRTPPRRAARGPDPRRRTVPPTANPTAEERMGGAETPERKRKRPATEEVASDQSDLSPDPPADPPAAAVRLSFQIVLLVLSLYEIQHYRFLSHAATVFDYVSVMTGWDDYLHVGFVAAALVSGVARAASASGRRAGADRTPRGAAERLLIFAVATACWLAVLPVFRDCTDGDSGGRRMCLFVARTARTRKGRPSKRATFDVTNPRHSLLDVFGREWIRRLTRFVKSKIKGRVFREVSRGLFRPFAFHGRLRRLLNVVKWAKYLAPLAGTCNKFRGHCLDMARKRGQRSRSRAAQQRWTDVLLAVTNQTRTERAVLQLQKAFRERRAAKVRRRFELIASRREGSSNDRVARKIRRELIVEQYSSRSKIRRIEELDSQREMRRVVSRVERDGIARHRESQRRMRKRLLLSPKTGFAVGWKYLTVSCVALEISQILLAPVLSGELKKMPLDRFLLTVMRSEGGGPAGRAVLAHVLARLLVPVVSSVFFLDVFITFFTGELSEAGTLVPKPAFARYAVPGVGLQLIVNPTMVRISRCVRRLALEAGRIGPSLCLQVALACLPFVARVVDVALDCIFNFVEGQNHRILKQNKSRNSM